MSQEHNYNDKRANPFEKVRVIKEINIYNRLDTKIKIIAQIDPQRDNIKSVIINRNYESQNNQNNEAKQNYYQKNLNSNDIENISQQNHLKETIKTNNNAINSKSNKLNDNITEDETISSVNGGISGSYSDSQQNETSDTKYNRSKKGGGGSIGYGVIKASINYQQENEQKHNNISNNALSKAASGSLSLDKTTLNRNKQKQLSSNSNEENKTNNFDLRNVDNNTSFIKNKDDILLNLEQKDSLSNHYNKDKAIKTKFNATVNYINSDIEQQRYSSIIIQPQSMGTIKMTVNDQSSLIYLTINIAEPNDNKNNCEWTEYCNKMGYDKGNFVLENNINNKPSFHPLCDEITEKIAESNKAKLIAEMDKNELIIKNQKIMENDWDEDDVSDYIKYLSRQYGSNIIDPQIADIIISQDIDGSKLYKITKKELKEIIKDKIATKKIYVELVKLRNGEISVPSTEELDYKEISKWDEDTVKMYICTIYNGKYFKYINLFKTTNGSDLLKMDKSIILKTKYNIKQPMHREEIWDKIQQIQQNKNVPTTKDIIKDFEKLQKPTAEGYLEVPQLQLSEIGINGRKHRTVMVLGQTGSGKTTLLNSMVNYLWNVKFEDKFRYKLIYEEEEKKGGQANSMTQHVTAYHLNPPGLDYELTVIDTPGFGDCRGIERDKVISLEIGEFFKTKIQQIDAVCIVICASQPRLSATQKYIFDQVLGLFGNDIKENIFILLTFADGNKPPALSAIKKDKIPYQTHFKLNNSAFGLKVESKEEEEDDDDVDDDDVDDDDVDDDDSEFNSLFWNMGIKSFDRLFEALNNVETVSLDLTKKVSDRRQQLEVYIENIQPTIRKGYDILQSIRKQIESVKNAKDVIDASKDFMIEVTVFKTRQVSDKNVEYTTACTECNYTCHASCTIKEDQKKKHCKCISLWSGNCTVCPGECPAKFHKMLPYRIEHYSGIEKRSIEELKNKYYDAKDKKSVSEQILDGLRKKLSAIESELYELINNVRQCTNELSEIALRPNIMTSEDYIDKMIKVIENESKENQENKEDKSWKNKIKTLMRFKEKCQIFDEINSKEFNPWDGYKDVSAFFDEMPQSLNAPQRKQMEWMMGEMIGYASSTSYGSVTEEKIDHDSMEKSEEEKVGYLDECILLISSEDDNPRKFEISRRAALMCHLVKSILEGDAYLQRIPIKKVRGDILELTVQYLKHHNGKIPEEIAKPIRSVKMERIVADKWDADYVNSMNKKTIFQIILAANYMDLPPLLHLGCAKIATLIKGKTPEEIKNILADDSGDSKQEER